MYLHSARNKRQLHAFLLPCKRFMSMVQTPKNAPLGSATSSVSFVDLVKQRLSFLNTKFFFRSGEIEIINTPETFYRTLKQKISAAEKRIFVASLYIGKTEDELIQCISRALEKNANLKVYFMVDGLRGTRESPANCSASLLAQLAKEHNDRVDIRLYKTPEIVGIKEALIPKRFNEGLGLQHMKIYGFDDEVILSGANLSSDYFTNRQDRYYLFKSKEFSDYYFKLHQLISSLSYKVSYSNNTKKYNMIWPKSNSSTEPKIDKKKFIRDCSFKLSKFLKKSNGSNLQDASEYPTVVYPVSQFTPLFVKKHDNSTEKPSILKLLSSIHEPTIYWTFTAGYFNMLPEIKSKLLATPSNSGKVITASPYANGFFESRGVSRHLPAAYLYLSKKFLQEVYRHGRESEITLNEWKKGVINKPGGWSYHAKGLWISENGGIDHRPAITVIGSSNYTRRAYSLDLESNAIIVTKDEKLKEDMQKEVEHLLSDTREVKLEDFSKESDRKVSPGVKIATKILGNRL